METSGSSLLTTLPLSTCRHGETLGKDSEHDQARHGEQFCMIAAEGIAHPDTLLRLNLGAGDGRELQGCQP